MAFNVITAYPADESAESADQIIKTTKKTINQNLEIPDVIDMYNNYERAGYNITVRYKTPTELGDAEAEEVSPFEIAEGLTKQGIDYKATLKVKNAAPYVEAKELVKLIVAHGYDAQVVATLKINEGSVVDFDHESSWTREDGKNSVYKVTPKASSTDVNELKGLYDTLATKGYEVALDIKPSAQSTDDDASDFANQLAIYPDGSEITLTLKEAE